ncbi:MAG: molybdopterin cofactor-binding domain-containing protein [Terriglobales bacterium]
MRRVLEAAVKQFDWKPTRAPSNQGIGIACGTWYKTCVATVVQVKVDKSTGKVQVERVATAVDAGIIVNPEGARQQVEGCVSMGLGYALSEEVRFSNGEILDKNFDTYEIHASRRCRRSRLFWSTIRNWLPMGSPNHRP